VSFISDVESVRVEGEAAFDKKVQVTAGICWQHWVSAAILLILFGPTIHWLWTRWTISVWSNAHGLFVPFLVAYLFQDILRHDTSDEPEASPLGFLFLGAGLSCLVADSIIGTELLAAFGMIVCLPGLSLLLLGRRRTAVLKFPLLLAFFMLPIPAAAVARVHLVLRDLSARGAEQIVSLFGLPVVREGTVLSLPTGDIAIADACSGFSTLYAAVTLSLVLAYWQDSSPRRWIIVASAVPLSIFFNMLRCAGLAGLVSSQGMWTLQTQLHVLSGMISFAAVLLILMWISRR
jgi:exosortase